MKYITGHFNVATAKPGDTVNISISMGEIIEHLDAEAVDIISCTFFNVTGSEAGRIEAPEKSIVDKRFYTEYSATVPRNMPRGECRVDIILVGPKGGIDYKITAEGLRIEELGLPVMTTVTPNSLTFDQLKIQNITVRGKFLDKVIKGSVVLACPTLAKMNIIGIPKEESLSLRLSPMVEQIEPGAYKIKARTTDGTPVFSRNNLTIR
jgi:hypothetical protein